MRIAQIWASGVMVLWMAQQAHAQDWTPPWDGPRAAPAQEAEPGTTSAPTDAPASTEETTPTAGQTTAAVEATSISNVGLGPAETHPAADPTCPCESRTVSATPGTSTDPSAATAAVVSVTPTPMTTALSSPTGSDPEDGEHEETLPDEESAGARQAEAPVSWGMMAAIGLPRGRDIANLEQGKCEAILRAHEVATNLGSPADAPDSIAMPIELDSAIGSLGVQRRSGAEKEWIDCRLAVALLAWEPTLLAHGIQRIDHLSIHRPGAHVRGSRHMSGHAFGLAIDAARFHLVDGRVLDIESDWADRTRGADPCASYPDEPEGSRLLREVVCEAADQDLFEVILTPHFDQPHHNHVHLEVRPNVPWSYVH